MAVTDRLEPTTSRVGFRSDILLGGGLAVLLSATSILILCYSLVGSRGSTVFTGTLLGLSEVVLLALTFRADIVIGTADYLFAAFLICVGVSFAINGRTANVKEWEIFAVSLAAYPACRFIPASRLAEGRTTFIWTAGIIVAIGTLITSEALISQWYDLHGKPIVSGFDAAATMFLGSLGFLLIALSTAPLTRRKTTIISASVFLPIAVFAASQVRFTFIAMIGSLCLAAIFNGAKQRKYIAVIALVVMAGICSGVVARSGTTKILVTYAMEETKEIKVTKDNPAEIKVTNDNAPRTTNEILVTNDIPAYPINEIKPPSCHLDVNKYNSVAIRKALLLDAMHIIPVSGAFGLGLDSFANISCMSTEVHNSELQALVEFGWIGGIALAALVVLSLALLLPMARQDADVRFVLCSLAYIVAISLAHGRTSRDILLFALLGLASGVLRVCPGS
jgi:hypothetical protein